MCFKNLEVVAELVMANIAGFIFAINIFARLIRANDNVPAALEYGQEVTELHEITLPKYGNGQSLKQGG